MKKFTSIAILIFAICIMLSQQSNAAIATPNLSSPITNITLKSFQGFLSVSTVTNATGYEVEYDTLSTFNSPHKRAGFSEGSYSWVYTKTLLMGKKYFWRARAFKAGDTSNWSNSWFFTVLTKYELQTPSDGLTGSLRSIYGTSLGSSIDLTYIFELDTAPTFKSSNRISHSQSQRLFIDSTFFKFGRKFYWRATGVNEFGDTLTWSDVRSYTIYAQPTVYSVSSQSDPEVALSWLSMELAEVLLDVDTTADFSSPGFIQKVFAPGTTRDTLRDLLFGKKYYYRVWARFDKQLSSPSTAFSFTVRKISSYFSPANNSTNQNLVTSISWGSMKGVNVWVQVDRDTGFHNLFIDTILPGYTFRLNDTLKLNTKYFWRVKYMHGLDTTDWVNLNFTTTPGQLTVYLPGVNATNQDVRLAFRFYPVSWAQRYLLEIDTGKVFTNTVSSERIYCTDFYDFSSYKQMDTLLKYGTTYVWRVRYIRNGDTSGSSQVRTFTTKAFPTPNYPSNNYVGIGTQTNILMQLIKGSDKVYWELDTTNKFDSPMLATGMTPHVPDDFSPTLVLAELPGDLRFETKYFWRTKFISRIDSSAWSPTYNFTTTQIPWLSAPVNNATGVAVKPTLKWGVQGSASDYIYQYQLSTDANMTGASTVSLAKESSAEAVATCTYATTYYWRARAFHTKDTSQWSPIWKFTTIGQPSIPKVVLGTPYNNQTEVSIPKTALIWNSAANATSYDIEVATDGSFTNIVAQANVEGMGVDFSGMKANERYYWHVRGVAGSLVGPWSFTWAFETVKNSSVNDVLLKDLLKVFPSPTSDVLHVEYVEPFAYQLHNTLGQIVLQSDQQQFNHLIETAALVDGVYWLSIASGNVSHTEMVVVRH